jgi:CarD family transcriptional regulator
MARSAAKPAAAKKAPVKPVKSGPALVARQAPGPRQGLAQAGPAQASPPATTPATVTAPSSPPASRLPTSVPEVKAAIERQIRATLLKDVTFRVGDKAVHPAHGVGEVTSIEKRDIGGQVAEFYVLKILEKGMKVMVPTGAAGHVGLRRVMSGSEAEEILETIRAREVAVDVQPWSRRFRIYTEMVNSGAASEIAKVFRDMNRLKFDKDLSFGERKLLDQARSLLLKELALAKNQPEADMAKDLQQIFTS